MEPTRLNINWDRITSLDDLKAMFKILESDSEGIPCHPDQANKLLKTGFFKKV